MLSFWKEQREEEGLRKQYSVVTYMTLKEIAFGGKKYSLRRISHDFAPNLTSIQDF